MNELLRPIGQQALGTALNAAVSFVLLAWLARELGVEQFGDYVALLSLATVALVFIEGGWPSRIYRDAAGSGDPRPRPDADLGRALAHVLLSASLLALATAWLAPQAAAWAAMICMGCVALMNLVSGRLRGRGRFGLDALWQFAGRMASAVAIVAALSWRGAEIDALFLAWSAGLLLVLAVGARQWWTRPLWPAAGRWWPVALPFLAVEACVLLTTKGDMAILGIAVAPGPELSLYAACNRLVEAALLLFAPVVNVLLRPLRQHRQAASFHRLLVLAAGAGAAAGTTLWLLALLAGTALMQAWFGADFAAAGPLLPWVLAALPFTLANLILFQAMLAQERERRLAALLLAGAGLWAMALGPLWTHFGAQAAALSTALLQVLLGAACLRDLRQRRPPGEPHADRG